MSLSVCRFRSFFFFLTSGTLSWVSGSDMMFYCFDSSGTLVMYMLCLLYLSSISVSSCFVPDPFWLFVPFLLFQIFPPFLHCLSFDFFLIFCLFLAMLGFGCCTGFSLAAEHAGGPQQAVFSRHGAWAPGRGLQELWRAHGLRCSAARGLVPRQGLNLCLLRWWVDSLPPSRQSSPRFLFKLILRWHLTLSFSFLLRSSFSSISPLG